MSVFFLKCFAVLLREIIVFRLGSQFLEVLFALKLSGYLCLARDLMFCASNEYEEIFVFDNLMLAPNVACLRCSVDDRLRNLE